MMRYTTLLFDLDYTLIDAHVSEAAAFEYTLRRAGAVDPQDYFGAFATINTALWAAVESDEITPNHVRTERFEQLVATTDLEANPVAMGDDYVFGLGAYGDLYPHARDVLEDLAQRATLALVTNGIGDVQRARLSRLRIGKYFQAIVISGEVGVAKPGSDIYDITFDALGHPDKASTLMIGDSLTSDMAGGISYGIPTCWYAPDSTESPDNRIDHQISDLTELPSVVAGH